MLHIKKRNLLLSVSLLFIFLLSFGVFAGPTKYGTACDSSCAPLSWTSCLSSKTTSSYGSFSSNPDCIYQYCGTDGCPTSYTSSCDFGDCALGTCMSGETFTANSRLKDCAGVHIDASRYLFAKDISPDSTFRASCIVSDNDDLTLGRAAGAFSQGIFYRNSYTQEYSSDHTLDIESETRFSHIQFKPLNYASDCTFGSFHGDPTQSFDLGNIDCPAGLNACCVESNYLNMNVNTISQDSNYAYLCAESRFPFSSFNGENLPSGTTVYYRRNIDYPYKIDRISLSGGSFTSGNPRDVLATNYMGSNDYGWLACGSDSVFYGSDLTTAVGTNLISSSVVSSIVSSTSTDQVTYNDFFNTYDPSNPGSAVTDFELISLGGLTELIESVRLASTSSDVVPTGESIEGYYSDQNYLNPSDVLDMFDSESNYIPSASLSGELYMEGTSFDVEDPSEFLLSGVNFDTSKKYLRIGIRKSGTSSVDFFDDTSAGFIFKMPGSNSAEVNLDFTDGVFKVQGDDPSTLENEGGLIKPVYVGYAEFSKSSNIGSIFDVIVYACPTRDFSDTSDCDYYLFNKTLSVSQVAEWKDTNLVESYFCSDTKIYECTGPTYYSMNPSFLDVSKKWSDTDYYFSRLRRTSQVVDLVYDPDYQQLSETSYENIMLYRTSSSSLDNTRLIANTQTDKFLFKDSLDGYDFLAFDFFTWNTPDTNLTLCIRDSKCCADVPQLNIFPRIFQNFKLEKSDFTGCDNDYTISNIYVSIDTSGQAISLPDGSFFWNIFSFDRIFLGKDNENPDFCGSDKRWHKDFDYDGWACENTAGLFWVGGAEEAEDADKIKDNNIPCCGDDPFETWELKNNLGACYNSNFVENGNRVLDSYRISDVDVHDDSEYLDYAKLLVSDGVYYSCNLDNDVSNLRITIGDTISEGATLLSMISDSRELSSCETQGNYYCSVNEGWRNNPAVDFADSVYAAKRTHISSIKDELSVTDLSSVYLYDGSEISTNTSLQARGIEDHNKPYLEECCPENWCWDGYSCIENQRDEPSDWLRLVKKTSSGSTEYRCIDGVWEETEKISTWQETGELDDPVGANAESVIRDRNNGPGFTHGYCPRITDCLVNPNANYNSSFDNLSSQDYLNGYVSTFLTNSPTLFDFTRFGDVQCISTGNYIGDYYCDNGDWKSRVALMSERLLNMTSYLNVQDYTLHCGRFDSVFNTIGSIPGVKYPEEYSWKGCVLRYIKNNGPSNPSDTSNKNYTIMALELVNNPLESGVMDSSDIKRVAEDDIFASLEFKSIPYSYYDKSTGILFFSKSGQLSDDMFDVSVSTGVLSRLLNFFKGIFSGSDSFDIESHISSNEFTVYDRLYLSKSDDGTIFAVSGFNAGRQIKTKIVYEGFDRDVIDTLKNRFDRFKQYESDRSSDYTIDLFKSPGNWQNLNDGARNLTVMYTVNNAFNPNDGKFYDDYVSTIDTSYDNVLWEALIDDFALQTRLVR